VIVLKGDSAAASPWSGPDLRTEGRPDRTGDPWAGPVGPDAAEAERRARDLLALARREAERLRAEARERGFAEGREEGLADGIARGERIGLDRAAADHAALAERWTQALRAFERDRSALLSAGRDGVLRLALAIAERIARRSLAVDPEAVGAELDAALGILGDCETATVEVPQSPRAAALASCGALSIVERDELAPGGVIVRTADGRVDASLETRIARVADAILANAIAPRTSDRSEP
jgi:flagellar assembly protein FliH